MRLSDESETEISLAMAGLTGAKARALHAYLRLRGVRQACLAILSFEGTSRGVSKRLSLAKEVLNRHGAVALGTMPAKKWRKGRFSGPYHRDEMLNYGAMVETLETAATWAELPLLYSDVKAALLKALGKEGTPPILMCHVSHVYETGASLYFTAIAKQLKGRELEQWAVAKRAACEAIVARHATITHHHAVGVDHAPFMEAEVGGLGLEILRAVKAKLDPKGILNPQKLLP
jgi:alkyldihydroxyacetonephosphate synthase